MTPTQQNILDAEQHRKAAVEQLGLLQSNLARRESRLANFKRMYMEEWQGVSNQREAVRQQQALVNLASHKCLELKVNSEAMEAVPCE